VKALGGIAPFGYRWQNGQLVIDESEAPVRKLIYELFLKHRRKKTVAKLLNDLGYRTRSSSLFSDTTIDRLLKDTTAKGIRLVDGKTVEVEPLVSAEIWECVNNILGSKPLKQTTSLFTGIAYCGCGGKMIVPSTSPKYVCTKCRRKILTDDLEAIFHSQLKTLRFSENGDLSGLWESLSQKEKRIIIEQICDRIVIEPDTIRIEFCYFPDSFKAVADEQQNDSGNETSTEGQIREPTASSISEPLLSEAEAAMFLGISRMTLFRKRNADEIGYFRVGSRIRYSREKHLIPYLQRHEKRDRSELN
jgi:hypothetical protein